MFRLRLVTAALLAVAAAAAGAWGVAGGPSETGAPEPRSALYPDGQVWRSGTVEMLLALGVDAIREVQVCGLTYPGDAEDEDRPETAERHYAELAVKNNEENRPVLEGFLALLKGAKPWSSPKRDYEPLPDRSLRVVPVEGEPFEIVYVSDLDEPFGGVASRRLKEALWSLGGGRSHVSVIHIVQGRVRRVLWTPVPAPHGGCIQSKGLSAEMHLTPQRGLGLYLKLCDGDRVVFEGETPLGYGDAAVCASSESGLYVALLERP